MSVMLQVLPAAAHLDAFEEELAKDIWDVRHLPGVRYAAHKSSHLLNFTKIPEPFRPVTKRYVKFCLTQHSQSDCGRRLRYLQLFFEFFCARYPTALTLQLLNRAEIEGYLLHLRSFKGSLNRQGKEIGDEHIWRGVQVLRHFLAYLERTDSAEAPLITLEKLIWPSDGGNRPRPQYTEDKYIPESVLQQLEQHVHKLPPKYMPIVIVLRASGWRIGDVLNLRYDTCLEKTASGWWLCGDILKTNVLHHKVPISEEIASIVAAQREFVKEHFTEQDNPARYLFPATSKRRKGRPVRDKFVQLALNRLAVTCEITGEDGNIFHFNNHAFRHTKAVELINAGMSLVHVQQWLAHLSPEMTLAYARLLDSTRRKEWEQAFAKGAVRLDMEGRPKAVNMEQLGNEQEIEWEHIRHHLDAVRLPNGYCFKPKKATCPTQDTPCYTCRHFCTTPDFLAQFEYEERELHELIVLGEKAGSEIWVERNTQKLNRVLPVIQVLRTGDLHHPAGKVMREYTLEERAKRNAG
jgi:integrase